MPTPGALSSQHVLQLKTPLTICASKSSGPNCGSVCVIHSRLGLNSSGGSFWRLDHVIFRNRRGIGFNDNYRFLNKLYIFLVTQIA